MELGYVDSSTENEDNMARVFSACPLSSSGFQFSNHTQLSEENFNTNLMGNIWEQTHEKKLQNQVWLIFYFHGIILNEIPFIWCVKLV